MEIKCYVCQNRKLHLMFDKCAFKILSFREEYRYVVVDVICIEVWNAVWKVFDLFYFDISINTSDFFHVMQTYGLDSEKKQQL